MLWSSRDQNSRAYRFFTLFSDSGEPLKAFKGESGFVLSGRARGILGELRRPAAHCFLNLRPMNHSSSVNLGGHLFLSLLVDFLSHTRLPASGILIPGCTLGSTEEH